MLAILFTLLSATIWLRVLPILTPFSCPMYTRVAYVLYVAVTKLLCICTIWICVLRTLLSSKLLCRSWLIYVPYVVSQIMFSLILKRNIHLNLNMGLINIYCYSVVVWGEIKVFYLIRTRRSWCQLLQLITYCYLWARSICSLMVLWQIFTELLLTLICRCLVSGCKPLTVHIL